MKFEYKGNIGGLKPCIMLLPFAAGSGAPVEPGDACLLAGGNFGPIASDTSMSAGVAIAQQRLTAYHAAGYYPALVPQDGDLFEVTLATTAAVTRGSSLYITDATQQVATSGTNVVGNVYDHGGYPLQQGNADVGDVTSRGTTVGSTGKVLATIKKAVSYLNLLQT